MIGYIKGTVEEMWEEGILLECAGIGYRIFVPSLFLNRLSIGETRKIYTYLSVKEDSMTLFGFADRDSLETYKRLLSVNGIGPKAAMNVLSFMTAEEFRMAVLAGDANKIAKTPGLGKKTAQKILLELKDKFDFVQELEDALGGSAALDSDGAADAVEALIALGYSGSDALKAVREAEKTGGAQDSGALLKQALKILG